MIIYKTGDLLDSHAQVLVNTVNCVGVCGKGLALAFKKKYRNNYRGYKKYCEEKRLKPGHLFVFQEGRKTIVNFATKDHWRNPSQMSWIIDGLERLQDFILSSDIDSIAVPALGCSNGQLAWANVKPEIYKAMRIVTFEKPNVDIMIYEPRQ